MGVSVGLVVLPTDRWPVARRQWEWAEAEGFAAAYTYDHLCWGGFPDGPWHAAYPLLAAAAGVTDSIRLGTLVTSPNFRHPVPLAREVITLDDLSQGRFDLGIGAGSGGPDARVLGRPEWGSDERVARFAEFLHLLASLLVHPRTTWSGGFYAADEAVTTPGCIQRPRVPFTVAGGGRRSMQVVARHGQRWVTVGPTGPGPRDRATVLAAVTRQVELLEVACRAGDRDPSSIDRVLLVTDPAWSPRSVGEFEDFAGGYEALGFAEIVLHHPDQTGPYSGDVKVFEQIAADCGQ